MYADRNARSSAVDPRSLGIAVALNGAALAALLLAKPALITDVRPKPPLPIYNVPIEPLPEPVPPAKPELRAAHHRVTVPKPTVDPTVAVESPVRIDSLPPSRTLDAGPVGMATATPTPQLILIAPEVDPAHRGDLQPVYPAGELRDEREGVVTVRVLIGVDGRVHQVEQVSATSTAFFTSTRDRALARWRFRPATRGGVPVEAWRTMTIRFVIPR